MHLQIREAKFSDTPLIAELTRICWADRVAASSSGHRESVEQVQQHLERGGAYLLLVDNKIVGSVRWLPLTTSPFVWEVMRMGVMPDYSGRSFGQHLLEAVIQRARSVNIREIRLAVRADQGRLLDLYAGYSFELAPELEYAHANPAEPAPTVMRRFLVRACCLRPKLHFHAPTSLTKNRILEKLYRK